MYLSEGEGETVETARREQDFFLPGGHMIDFGRNIFM